MSAGSLPFEFLKSSLSSAVNAKIGSGPTSVRRTERTVLNAKKECSGEEEFTIKHYPDESIQGENEFDIRKTQLTSTRKYPDVRAQSNHDDVSRYISNIIDNNIIIYRRLMTLSNIRM